MYFTRPRTRFILTASVALGALLGLDRPVSAQTANTTPENVAVFNLLSPFFSLNSNTTGQQTLQLSLSQSVAINQNSPSAALLNGNLSTPTLAALSISDENLLGKTSNNVTGLSATYGIAANLAGGLPTQNTTAWAMYAGQQPVGAFGSVLGPAYVSGVGSNGAPVTLQNTINLLVAANTQIVNNAPTSDSQIAKFYFANGTVNSTTAAVAPAGLILPTANGYPNKTSSVYDSAFGVANNQTGQNAYGNSHPYQTAPVNGYNFTLYDSTVKTASTAPGAPSPSLNPAFPSSHMAYATTDGLLLGMMTPQLYQSSLLRASEMGESRIVVGVHYPTDIIASRAFASFDLANLLSNPAYINNAAVTGTAINLPGLFNAAAPQLQSQLTLAAAAAGCGTSGATCATSGVNMNPYAPSATNQALYQARLTYGLPTLSFAAAPQEAAPAGSPDASILLTTLYGGSTTAARTIAPGGGAYAALATGTVNQIIQNTEFNALTAFYGNSLSYWSRINLYDAAGYFGGTSGTLSLAKGDLITSNVTVGSGSQINGAGATIGALNATNNLTVMAGGILSPGAPGETMGGTLTVNGTLTLAAGGTLQINAVNGSPTGYDQLNVTGPANLAGLLDIEANNVNNLAYPAGGLDILNAGGFSGDFNGVSLDGQACKATATDVYQCGFGITITERFTGGALDLAITDVPEPATFALLLGPAAALAMARRRRWTR